MSMVISLEYLPKEQRTTVDLKIFVLCTDLRWCALNKLLVSTKICCESKHRLNFK